MNKGIKVDINDKNIVGYIGANRNNNTSDGNLNSKAKFFISFNKDNTGDCKYLSVNNLMGNVDNITSPSDSSKLKREVPFDTVYVVSKGVSGKCVRYVEVLLSNDGNAVLDGATTIGGAVDISSNYDYSTDLPLLRIKHSDPNYYGVLNTFDKTSTGDDSGGNSVKIKSKSDTASVDTLINLNNKVSINSSSHDIGNNKDAENLIFTKDSLSGVESELKSLETIQSAKEYLKVDTKKATELAGGTYIYVRDRDNKDSQKPSYYWIHVDSDTVDQAVNDLNSNTDNITTNLNKNGIVFGGEDENNQSRSVVISNNITLESGSNLNFVVVDKDSIKNGETTPYKQSDATVDFQIQDNKFILNENGNINIYGEVTGSGSMIVNGNVTFNAGSSLESDINSKLAVWAGNNINIERAMNLSSNTTEGGTFVSLKDGDTATNVDHGEEAEDIKAEFDKQQQDPVTYKTDIEEATNLVNYENNTITINEDGKNISLNIKNGVVQQLLDVTREDLIEQYSQYIPNIESLIDNDPMFLTGDYYNNNPDTWDQGGAFCELAETISSDFIIKPRYDNSTGGQYGYHSDFDLYHSYGVENYYVGTFVIQKVGDKNFDVVFLDNINTPQPKSDSSFSFSSDNKYNTAFKTALGGSQASSSSTSGTTQEIKNNMKKPENIIRNGTSFKGTLYSTNGKITINADNSDLKIKGSIMTLNGGLNINNAQYIDLIYDPDYVPFFKDKGIKTGIKFMSEFI